MKKYIPFFILFLFCIPLFFFNIHSFCDWGDDFSQYIKEAQNIATGKPYYQSNYIYNRLNTDFGPPQYSPGFPLLLAPVVKIWGIAIRPMLYLMTVLTSALLFALFFYFRKHTSDIVAICLSVIVVYSPGVIDLKQEVLSDIPCLLFITIYLALRQTRLSALKIVLLTAVGVFAVLIRTQAIFLSLAEFILVGVQLIKHIRRHEPVSIKYILRQPGLQLALSVPIVFLLLNGFLFAAPQSSLDFYFRIYFYEIHGFWKMLGFNDNYFISLLQQIFYHQTNDPFFEAPVNIMIYAAILFSFIGFWISVKKELTVGDLFLLLTTLLIIVTPVYQGVRYIFPIFAVLFLYIKTGMSATLPAAMGIRPVVLAIAFTAIYLALNYDYYDQTTRPVTDLEHTPFSSDDIMALSYIRKNITDRDIIVYAKPRALTLFTGKRAIVMATQTSFEQNKRLFDSLAVKYMLVRDYTSEPYYKDYLYHTHSNKDSVIINSKFTLYRMR